MPTDDSSEPEPCAKCGDDLKGTRWQAAIKSSEGGLGREPGSTPAGVGWYWASVCAPCFWLVPPHRGVVGKRGPPLEDEL